MRAQERQETDEAQTPQSLSSGPLAGGERQTNETHPHSLQHHRQWSSATIHNYRWEIDGHAGQHEKDKQNREKDRVDLQADTRWWFYKACLAS